MYIDTGITKFQIRQLFENIVKSDLLIYCRSIDVNGWAWILFSIMVIKLQISSESSDFNGRNFLGIFPQYMTGMKFHILLWLTFSDSWKDEA